MVWGGEKPEGGGPSVRRPPAAWLAAALAVGGSLELAFELADDRGEDMRCLAGLGADHAEPFHGQLVAVNVRFLVEVQSAGEVFQVRHVGVLAWAVPGNPTVAATSAMTATSNANLFRIRAAGVPDHVNDIPFMYSPPSWFGSTHCIQQKSELRGVRLKRHPRPVLGRSLFGHDLVGD